jgi:hypothetical protein
MLEFGEAAIYVSPLPSIKDKASPHQNQTRRPGSNGCETWSDTVIGGHEVPRTMRYTLLWDVTQRWKVVLCRRFDTTYRSHLQGWRSRRRKPSWTFWPLKMRLIGCVETSARDYHWAPRNLPEERRSGLHRGGSLRPRVPRAIRAPGREKITGEWRKLRDEELLFSKYYWVIRLSGVTGAYV